MIREIRLHNFKGFQRFALPLNSTSVLVGPNNAGKSTAIAAIRAVAGMRARATRDRPRRFVEDQTVQRPCWPVPLGYGLSEENLRFDFLPERVRIIARFSSGARLQAAWPGGSSLYDDDMDDEPEDPFFYVTSRSGDAVAEPSRVRAIVPEIGIVPILYPIDLHEGVRARDTVIRNLSGRLASRHFRNQLLLLTQQKSETGRQSAFHDFLAFAEPWLADVDLDIPDVRAIDKGSEIDVFFYERRRPRELAWAGDGFQVFLQILFHMFRLRSAETVVLDEPDVYLHPDLQRRLFQVVDSHPGQVIFASHSSELVAEAPPESIIWIDRTRTKAIAAPDARTLEALSAAIGSGFNLRLARVLRARCVVFVEGKDATILRIVARRLGLQALVAETSVATVALGGEANRARLESFGWIAERLLSGAVNGYVLLDRDYRSTSDLTAVEASLRGFGLEPHVWRRKELESYLLESAPLARLIGASSEWVDTVLAEESESLRNYVLSQLVSVRYQDRSEKRVNIATVTGEATADLDSFWGDPLARRWRCPAKDLLSAVNRRAQADGFDTVTAYAIAKDLREGEVSSEMVNILNEINVRAAG